MTSSYVGTPSAGSADQDTDRAAVTVIGLGSMGRALAGAFLAAGHPTTVWNRTPAKADELAAGGAVAAPAAAAAISASRLVVVCVVDSNAVHAVLEPVRESLRGRVLVNLTSTTPEQARATAAWAVEHGIEYLHGASKVPTPMIGDADALVLYSGSHHAFDQYEASLAAIAGDGTYLGGDAGLASVYDVGMLDIFFTGMTGFLHAAALVGADGISASTFLPYAQRIGELVQQTMVELAADVDKGSYPGDQDNLEMEQAALEHIVEASAARGIATALPRLVQTAVSDAIARGHGRDGFSSVVEVLRTRSRAS
ncbi:MAG TPA: NAD(P)-binding domain-containing protein [Jiangellaceae bacterium]|nr:NAD(P)-binding domain-containing protein [Jiangellaceae bacterium]